MAPVEFKNSKFFYHQSRIIPTLDKKSFYMALFIIPTYYPPSIISKFLQIFKPLSWKVSKHSVTYSEYGDTIEGSTILLSATNTNMINDDSHGFELIKPPIINKCLNDFIYQPFNTDKYNIFDNKDQNLLKKEPSNSISNHPSSKTLFHLIKKGKPIEPGTAVIDSSGLVPSLCHPNENIFSRLFGITFTTEKGDEGIRKISAYEYASSFQFDNTFTTKLAESEENLDILEHSLPGKTSA